MSATSVEKGNTATEDSMNEVSNALASTTLNDKVDAASLSAAEGRRLYIGNLAYAATEEDLRQFFAGFLVETISIPVNPRTERPVGYAFVDLSTPSEASRAIEELSGREVLERKVSVQLAHKRETESDRKAAGRPARHRSGRAPRAGRNQRRVSESAGVEDQPLGDITNRGAEAADKSAKVQKAPRQRGPPADGIASTTKVMVANLPYDLTEEKLMEVFADFSPVSAKIALRPIPRFMIKKLQERGEPRKGRGIGFVTFASEEKQLEAVRQMNNVEVEGREIVVKVAIDSPGKTENVENEQGDLGENQANGTKEDTTEAATEVAA